MWREKTAIVFELGVALGDGWRLAGEINGRTLSLWTFGPGDEAHVEVVWFAVLR